MHWWIEGDIPVFGVTAASFYAATISLESYMKFRSTLILVTFFGSAVLAGCTSYPSQGSGGMSGMSKSDADMASMCDMHKKMMGSMSTSDQKKMMDMKMKDMSPEMRAKHMEEMSQCK